MGDRNMDLCGWRSATENLKSYTLAAQVALRQRAVEFGPVRPAPEILRHSRSVVCGYRIQAEHGCSCCSLAFHSSLLEQRQFALLAFYCVVSALLVIAGCALCAFIGNACLGEHLVDSTERQDVLRLGHIAEGA
eukprot:5274114-Amphidinium_carterae.1